MLSYYCRRKVLLLCIGDFSYYLCELLSNIIILFFSIFLLYRFEIVWRQAIQQLLKDDNSQSFKEQIKKEICLKLSIEAMKEVTEEYEIDIRIAEEILMKRNEIMGLHF